jgi:class 3 adenylate cyclase
MVFKEKLTNQILFGSSGYVPTIEPQEDLTNQILFGASGSKTSSEPQTEEEGDFVEAVGDPTNFCVGIIDIVNSTKIVSRLSPNKASKYYMIFHNHMAKIVHQYNGKILKTMGDSLLYYFPDTSYAERKFGFLSAIECGFEMMESHEKLKILLGEETLPQIDFRISFDYGNVTMMRNQNGSVDLVGPTINTCAKINGICPVNGMIVGSDLHEKAKNFKEYKYKNSGSFSIDSKHPYPVFTLCRKY